MSGATTPATPLRAVVIDDTPDLRELMRIALERTREFVVVGEADNGLSGVRVSARQQPDVVFLDVAMPVMDGLEALPLIRQACPAAAIVMLSGFGASEMTGRALVGGADGYVQKGQPLSALLAQVRVIVSRRAIARGVLPEPEPQRQSQVPAAAPFSVPAQGGGRHQDRAQNRMDEPAAPDPLELAPFGFLLVRRGRVLRSNREAARLIGDLPHPGAPLAQVAPELATHLVKQPDTDSALVFGLGEPPRRVEASVRRAGEDHAIYLSAQAEDEADLLRRAIATAAHEVRGPVAVLMGVAETLMLHGEELGQRQQERMLGVIERQTRLLDNITADLLAAGQAQHGTLAMQLEKVDTTTLVRSVLDDGFDLVVEQEAPSHVLTDPLRFQQMLSNLLSNARKYGEAPYLVRISPSGAYVRIEVEDNGQGVPDEFVPRLFQEYSRAPGTAARGTGLGLFVVRALAEAQGGAVTYAPRTPHGSVFTLRLPAAAAEEPPQ